MNKIKIIIADDHPLVREGIKDILCFKENIEVVGEAGTGFQLIEIFDKIDCDLVIMDVNMPGHDVINSIKTLKNKKDDIPIIVYTVQHDFDIIKNAFEAGAMAYITKDCIIDEIYQAIDSALNGKRFLSADLRNRFEKFI